MWERKSVISPKAICYCSPRPLTSICARPSALLLHLFFIIPLLCLTLLFFSLAASQPLYALCALLALVQLFPLLIAEAQGCESHVPRVLYAGNLPSALV
jgi:hypothetical protein